MARSGGLLPCKPRFSLPLTMLSSWSGQLISGPLQGILDTDSHLKSVRQKALFALRCLGKMFYSELLSPRWVNNERRAAENRAPIQHKERQDLCQLKPVVTFIGPVTICIGR